MIIVLAFSSLKYSLKFSLLANNYSLRLKNTFLIYLLRIDTRNIAFPGYTILAKTIFYY